MSKRSEKLDLIIKKRQFLIDRLGEKKLESSEIAFDQMVEELGVSPAELVTLAECYRLLVLLPDS